MRKKEIIFVGVILCLIIGLFFNKFFLNGYIPFPGDLLINEYSPWKYYSYLGYNPGSYPTKFQFFDVIRQIYPWKVFVIEQLKNGQIPLWNPYNFAGTPLLANFQSQVFAPFNIFYFIFPQIYSWTIGLMMQTILAFLFTYFYVRQMKLGREGAILAGVAYACSLYMSVFFQYEVFGQTILWLPLILLSIEKIIVKFSIKNILLFIAAITFAAFGGHLQVFSYVLVFSLFYLLIRLFFLKQNRIKKLSTFSFSLIIAFGIASIQLFPSFELIGLSARAPHDIAFFLENFLLKTQELILFISPDFYGNPTTNNYLLSKSYPQTALYIGAIPLIFALSTIFLKKNNFIKFYIGIFIAALIGVTNNPLSVFFYSLQIPIISSSSPTNGIFIISFSLSILAGYGLDQWVVRKNKFPFLVSVSVFILLLLIFGLHKTMHIDFSSKNALYSLIVIATFFFMLLITRFIQKRKIFAIILIVFTVFDLFYFFQKFNPFVPKSFVFPETEITKIIQQHAGIKRVWGYGFANILANTNSIYSFSSPDGYDPLYPRRYGEFLYASNNGKLLEKFGTNTRSNAEINSSLGFISENKNALKILDVLGVYYIVDREENGSTEKIFPSSIFKLIYNHDGWKLYENSHAAERAFLTSDYQIYTSNKEFEKIFFSDAFNPTQTLLLEEKPDFQAKKNEQARGEVNIQKYMPNKITLQVKTNTKKLLFLSDMYYPGWKAYVDGKETHILRANYTFRAIEVSQGSHTVEFVYKPQSFYTGMIVSFVSLGILFIVGGILYVRKLHHED
jgi:uncharacterized membrane protein YfhO